MASVLTREIRDPGYDGSDSVVRHWVSSYKPVAKDDPLVRFETPRGEQMQAEFISVRRRARPLLALVADRVTAVVHL